MSLIGCSNCSIFFGNAAAPVMQHMSQQFAKRWAALVQWKRPHGSETCVLIGLDIEVDNGVYFCYNHTDKQFVCQGGTVAEIRKSFGERFPGKTAYLAGGDPAVVDTFKTELLKLSINEPNNNV